LILVALVAAAVVVASKALMPSIYSNKCLPMLEAGVDPVALVEEVDLVVLGGSLAGFNLKEDSLAGEEDSQEAFLVAVAAFPVAPEDSLVVLEDSNSSNKRRIYSQKEDLSRALENPNSQTKYVASYRISKSYIFSSSHPSPALPTLQSSKHIWLVVFYSNQAPACAKAKPHVEKLAEKVKDSFKVGAVDCASKEREAKFCMDMGVDMESLPAFAMVIGGKLEFYFDDSEDENNPQLPTAKGLHEFAIDHMPKSLVHNINHVEQAKERLLSKQNSSGAVLLLTDKYETAPLYYSLAYHYRQNFIFGESRAKNLKLVKEFGVKKYPLLVAIVPKGKGEESYSDTHDLVRFTSRELKGDPIIKWLDGVLEKVDGKGKKKTNTTQKPTTQKRRNRQKTEF